MRVHRDLAFLAAAAAVFVCVHLTVAAMDEADAKAVQEAATVSEVSESAPETDHFREAAKTVEDTEELSEPLSCTLTVTTFYDVPLDTDLQAHIINECGAYGIDDPGIILAMIQRESSYDSNSIGDNGMAYGLMQVWPKWHWDRMERLGVTDLLNPYQNVTVGIDYLAELLEKYDGNMTMALVAYNKGPSDAYEDCFSKGVYSSWYSDDVWAIRETIGDLT